MYKFSPFCQYGPMKTLRRTRGKEFGRNMKRAERTENPFFCPLHLSFCHPKNGSKEVEKGFGFFEKSRSFFEKFPGFNVKFRKFFGFYFFERTVKLSQPIR